MLNHAASVRSAKPQAPRQHRRLAASFNKRIEPMTSSAFMRVSELSVSATLLVTAHPNRSAKLPSI
jgi:hypothetical protein